MPTYSPGIAAWVGLQIRDPHLVCKNRGGRKISRDRTRVNAEIQAPQVRVIDSDGKQLGILPRREALRLAGERSLDLVEVAPNADPPVAKLMDFGKYQYERAKREREARKARKEIEVKEVRLRPKTDEHDINFKVRQARAFLASGAKVKIRMRFRGREIYNLDVAKKQFDHFAGELADVGTIEQNPSFEGRTMLMIMAPSTGRK